MTAGATGRRSVAVAIAAICVAACSSTSSPPNPVTDHSPQVLHLNFANPPERWPTVATFTYGNRAGQLGLPAGHEPFPPAAIVVTGGSLWVLDQNKHRVAHFTLTGRYLGEVRGISATATDLAPYPSGRFLVVDNESRATVRTFATDSARASRAVALTHRGGELARLIPTDTGLGALLSPIGRPTEAAVTDVLSPVSFPPRVDRRIAGVPEYDDRFTWTGDLAALEVAMKPAWDRRYSFPGGHNVVLEVDSAQIAQRHAYFGLGVAGSQAGAGVHLLLELDAQGNVASLERVATPRWSGSAEVQRQFAVTADGRVYQWFTTPTQAELRVRP